jgi:YbbR domain-containing protein
MINFFRHHVVHNFSLKLLSVLMAAGLWLMINRDEQPAEEAIRAPIVLRNVPSDLEISSESIPEAQIRVRGPERLVRQLKVNEVQAEIDLSNIKSGERTFDLTAQQVRHPRDVAIVQIVPSQLHLAFDTRFSREVEIHPRVIGNFASGEQVVKVETDPSRVTIVGPRHHVERIDAALTDPIDASGLRGSAVFTTNAYVADPLVQIDKPSSIHVTVVVGKTGSSSGR